VSSVSRVAVAPDVLAGLPGAQYSLAFELSDPVARSRTPEVWARAVFEGAPPLWRWVLTLGWRFGLGLRLGPIPSRWHVQGWPIVSSEAQSITLAAQSRWLSARAVFVVSDDSVTWVTLVRYDRPLGRVLWRAAAPIHHLTVPPLLRRAARVRPTGQDG
jgi:hypothetical protein